MQYNILGVIVTFLIVYAIEPILMKLSNKVGFTDKPTKRKKHSSAIPLCGGIGIYIGFCIFHIRNHIVLLFNLISKLLCTLISCLIRFIL